jgi:hypothetical protein
VFSREDLVSLPYHHVYVRMMIDAPFSQASAGPKIAGQVSPGRNRWGACPGSSAR